MRGRKRRLQPLAGLDDGDVVLIGSPCAAMPLGWPRLVCEANKRLANSQFDHCGVVVLRGGVPHLLECSPGGGTTVTPLARRLAEGGSATFRIRRLHVARTSQMRAALAEFASEVEGSRHTRDVRSLLNACVRSKRQQKCEKLQRQWAETAQAAEEASRRGAEQELTRLSRQAASLEARLHKNELRLQSEAGWFDSAEDADAEMFAARLVAKAYQRMGLLSAYPSSGSYRAKDFSEERRGDNALELLLSAELGPEVSSSSSPQSQAQARARAAEPEEGVGVGEGEGAGDDSVAATLRRTYPFTKLSSPDLVTALAARFERREVPAGSVMCQQDETGTGMFVVERGEFEVYKRVSEDGPSELVAVLGRGNAVGSRSLESSAPRSGTVVCGENDCTVWWLARETYLETLRDHGIQHVREETSREAVPIWLREQLRQHFLFRSPRSSSSFSEFFRLEVPAGEPVFQQGQLGDNLYVVESGELERELHHPWQQAPVRVDTLRPGRTFGELALMYNSTRSSTVRAKTPAVLWALNRESFDKLHLGHGAAHLQRVFRRHASYQRGGVWYMTGADLARASGSRSPLLLKLLDSNDSGRIDFGEYVRFELMLGRAEATVELAFSLLDEDRDGYISAREFRHGMTTIAGVEFDPSPEVMAQLFGPAEAGEMTYFEFRQFVRDHGVDQLLADVESVSRSWRQSALTVGGASSRGSGDGRSMVASLAAVVVSRTAVAPLDRLKLMQQVGGRTPAYPGLVSGALKLWRTEGVRGLFRANGTNLARIVPFTAITLVLGDGLVEARIGSDDDGELTPFELVVAGGGAGVVASFLTYPLDVARAQMAKAGSSFPGTLAALRHVRASGTLYAGFVPTLLGVFTCSGLSFGIREALTPVVPRANDGSSRPAAAWALVCGVLASRVSQLAAYPLDTVRRTMQVGSPLAAPTMRGTFRNIVADGQSRKALFRGVVPNLAKIVPTVLLTLGTCEAVMAVSSEL